MGDFLGEEYNMLASTTRTFKIILSFYMAKKGQSPLILYEAIFLKMVIIYLKERI